MKENHVYCGPIGLFLSKGLEGQSQVEIVHRQGHSTGGRAHRSLCWARAYCALDSELSRYQKYNCFRGSVHRSVSLEAAAPDLLEAAHDSILL